MKSRLNYVKLPLLALILLQAIALAVQKQKEAGAKDLFYDPVTGATLTASQKEQKTQQGRTRIPTTIPAKVRYPGLHYWIELEGNGPVTDKRVFRTGERIQLYVRSNVDGYLSLWALDSSGRGKVLFPPAGGQADNSVKADSVYALPGFIRFTPPPEDERMLLFFSRNKDEVPQAQETVTESSKFLAKGQKSLEFETDDKNTAEIGTYIVSRQGGPIATVVRLKHQ